MRLLGSKARCVESSDASGLARARDAEDRMRTILADAGLDQPDEWRHLAELGELHLIWQEQKLCVVIELLDGE
jgi:hypothetical protein